jgi:hypothetical protein
MWFRQWVVVFVFIAALSWLAAKIVTALSGHGPMFWGILRPDISEPLKLSVIYAQWLFDALAFSVPAGAVLALIAPCRPLALALVGIAGYSLAFFVWGLVTSANVFDVATIYTSPNHLLLVIGLRNRRTSFPSCRAEK